MGDETGLLHIGIGLEEKVILTPLFQKSGKVILTPLFQKSGKEC